MDACQATVTARLLRGLARKVADLVVEKADGTSSAPSAPQLSVMCEICAGAPLYHDSREAFWRTADDYSTLTAETLLPDIHAYVKRCFDTLCGGELSAIVAAGVLIDRLVKARGVGCMRRSSVRVLLGCVFVISCKVVCDGDTHILDFMRLVCRDDRRWTHRVARAEAAVLAAIRYDISLSREAFATGYLDLASHSARDAAATKEGLGLRDPGEGAPAAPPAEAGRRRRTGALRQTTDGVAVGLGPQGELEGPIQAWAPALMTSLASRGVAGANVANPAGTRRERRHRAVSVQSASAAAKPLVPPTVMAVICS